MRKILITGITLGLAGFMLAGCPESTPAQPSQKQIQMQKAKEAANSVVMTENAEIDNIKRRIELTSNPGAMGFVLLMNEAGQPIMYTGVKGKITSGGKRLTPQVQEWRIDRGEWSGTALGPSPTDEGTWGSSSEYIYFWTVNGQYMQWNGKYLYSDKPFRLTVEPLVVDVK